MDSFELNKIMGAVLATCLVLLATSFAAGAIFSPVMPAKPGFEIAVKEEAPGGKEAPPPPAGADGETPAARVGRKGPRGAQEVGRLPRLHQGRPQQGRSEP